ncbi:MAG: hypothetical protein ABIK65_07510 [Candidatus Eisenbacteria bacterium]
MKSPKTLILVLIVVAFAALGSYQLFAGGTQTADAGDCGSGAMSACDGCTMKCPGMEKAEAAQADAAEKSEEVAETP